MATRDFRLSLSFSLAALLLSRLAQAAPRDVGEETGIGVFLSILGPFQ